MSNALNLAPYFVENENPELQAYLDELRAYLTDVVPDWERDNLLEETYDHLFNMIRSEEEHSISRLAATRSALASFGSARRNAEEMIEMWQKQQPQHPSFIIRRFGLDHALVIGLFGCTNLAYWILLQARAFWPAPDALNVPWNPAQVRRYLPEPFPFPDFSIQFLLISGFPIIAPFIIGWTCGRKIPVRAHVTVYEVLMPIILTSFLIGLLLLPVTDGLVFAVFQTIFWLPVGCLMAYLSSSLAWRSRRQKFGRAASPRTPRRTT